MDLDCFFFCQPAKEEMYIMLTEVLVELEFTVV